MGQKLTGFKGSKLIIKSVGCSSRKILGAKVKNNVIVGLEEERWKLMMNHQLMAMIGNEPFPVPLNAQSARDSVATNRESETYIQKKE